jgi:hypothetical protein
MTPTQIAWAAGLFEGEGSFFMDGKQPVMEIGMTDLDVIQRFADLTDAGWIRTKERPGHWKTIFIHRVKGRHKVTKLIETFLPYLGNRRAHKALDILDQLELAT